MMRKIVQNLSVCLLFTFTLSVFAQTSGPARGALFIHGGGGFNLKEFIQLSKKISDKKHQEGFAFLTNAALDVHVGERKRETDLLQVFSAKKRQLQNKDLETQNLLGIGIDQGTAITVIGDTLTVSGSGKVYIFNPKQWDTPKSAFYTNLSNGQIYDLKQRTLVP